MLILTRKEDETIVIDDNIKIKVVELKGGRVQLGIDAPEEIKIHREEVYQEIQEENQKAAAIKKGLSNKLLKQARDNLKKDE